MKPLAIDLFCGLGGWTDGLLMEGWQVVGFDIERHEYGDGLRYTGQLVLQDVLTLHGRQFSCASLIVASPPCQAYSYMAMPWSRAKRMRQEYLNGTRNRAELTALFDACFRIQREAIAAKGRFIPLIVENVRGAQEWVGQAKWHYGSYYLWGDLPALMPYGGKRKSHGMNWSDRSKRGQDFTRVAGRQAFDGFKGIPHRPSGHWTNPAEHDGIKLPGNNTPKLWSARQLQRLGDAYGPSRKASAALIAKIPLPLARHIGWAFA